MPPPIFLSISTLPVEMIRRSSEGDNVAVRNGPGADIFGSVFSAGAVSLLGRSCTQRLPEGMASIVLSVLARRRIGACTLVLSMCGRCGSLGREGEAGDAGVPLRAFPQGSGWNRELCE